MDAGQLRDNGVWGTGRARYGAASADEDRVQDDATSAPGAPSTTSFHTGGGDELGHHGPRSPLGPSAGDSVVQVEHVSKEIDLHEPGSVGRMNAMLTAGASQFDPRIWGEAEERRDTSAVYVM